jgi:hypothetical protein
VPDQLCPSGHAVAAGAAFCTTCGAALAGVAAPPTPSPARCPNGHATAPDARFCGACGAGVASPTMAAVMPSWPQPAAAAAPAPWPALPAPAPAGAWAPGIVPPAPFAPQLAYARPPMCTLAIVAFLVGLVWFYGLTSIAAIVLAVVALGRIRDRRERGRALAVWAIVFGTVGLCVALGILVAHTG